MNEAKKRVLICEFHEESNTFNPEIAGMEYFGNGGLEGQKIIDQVKNLRVAFMGTVDAVLDGGGEAVPGISLYSGSAGVVSDGVFEHLLRRTEYYIREKGPFDGVFLCLHGATVSESHPDACGDYIEFVRRLAGPKTVIAASFDLHANITEKTLNTADAVCAYQSYPHVDFYETGYRAGSLGMRLLAGKPTVSASVTLPIMVPPSGYSSLSGLFGELIAYGKELIRKGTLLDFTVTQVQPWLDVPVIGSVCLAVAEDPETACRCAEILAEKLFAIKDDCWPDMMSIDEIIDLAEKQETPKPVILADAADSPNGGAVGDSVAEALRLYERGSRLRTGLFVKDPETVEKAFEVGVGGKAVFSIGGKITPGAPGPLVAEGTVKMLADGEFQREGPAEKGAVCRIGKTCVIRIGTMDIMVCERPTASGDPQILRHFGIEPKLLDLVVVKANTSFLVPYGAFAGTVYFADTPGAGAPNLKKLSWKNLPAGFYPFDLPPDYKAEKAVIRPNR